MTTLSLEALLGGEGGSSITVALRFASAPGLPPTESAFAAASGTMRFSEARWNGQATGRAPYHMLCYRYRELSPPRACLFETLSMLMNLKNSTGCGSRSQALCCLCCLAVL